jgi:hypothetical protein
MFGNKVTVAEAKDSRGKVAETKKESVFTLN